MRFVKHDGCDVKGSVEEILNNLSYVTIYLFEDYAQIGYYDDQQRYICIVLSKNAIERLFGSEYDVVLEWDQQIRQQRLKLNIDGLLECMAVDAL